MPVNILLMLFVNDFRSIICEVLGLSIPDFVAYFYANDCLVTLTQPERLQWAFGVLTCLFDQVGLRTNMRKMVSMDV